MTKLLLGALLFLAGSVRADAVIDPVAERWVHFGLAWAVGDAMYETWNVSASEKERAEFMLLTGGVVIIVTQTVSGVRTNGMDAGNAAASALGTAGAIFFNVNWGEYFKVAAAPGGAMVCAAW